MRRLMSLLVAVFFSASLAGCCCGSRGSCESGSCGGGGHGISQGMCDCETDDHCLERAPWLRFGVGSTAPVGEPIPVPPTKLPDGKKL